MEGKHELAGFVRSHLDGENRLCASWPHDVDNDDEPAAAEHERSDGDGKEELHDRPDRSRGWRHNNESFVTLERAQIDSQAK